MSTLSIKQFEKAKKYEPQFQSAVYSRYLRAQPTSYYADLADLCNELKIRLNLNCPACVLNAVTQLGRMYFETKEEMIKETEKSAVADPSDKSDNLNDTNAVKTVSKAVQVKSKTTKSKSNKTNNKTKKK